MKQEAYRFRVSKVASYPKSIVRLKKKKKKKDGYGTEKWKK